MDAGPQPAGSCRFEILGPLRAVGEHGALELGPPRQRAVLVAVLLGGGRPVAPERVIETVWGPNAPAQATNLVQKYVSGLRRALGDCASLDWTGTGYRIDTAGRLDLAAFEEATARARAHRDRGDAAAAEEAFSQGLSLWRGPFAEGLTGVGIELERERLAERRMLGLEELWELRLDLGTAARELADLAALASLHPLRERIQAQWVLALAQAGRQAEALAAYARIRRLLADQHGLDPGPALREAHERVLVAPDALHQPTGPGRRPAGAAEQPRTTPAQLPHEIDGFTGRTETVAQITTLLQAQLEAAEARTMPLVCVEGSAGVGKTALAVHCAHQVQEHYPDGQLFVDLRGFDPERPPVPPEEVLGSFLRALGVPQRDLPSDLAGRVGLYRSLVAAQRILIVLDNAADAGQLRPLLPGGRGCAVLVTSRRGLASLAAREGARRIQVPVLTTQDAHELMGRLVGQEQLAAEPWAAEEIVRLCGRVPLALRVVAANSASRPGLRLRDLTAELAAGGRLTRLASPDDEATGVAASIRLSYDRLAVPSRRMLRLLGVAPGNEISVRAAAALADVGAAEARALLTTLTTAYLVEEATQDRYRFHHDLLVLFARDTALAEEPPAEREAALVRLLAHYLRMVRSAATAGAATDAVAAAVAELELELPSLLTAVEHAAAHGPHPVAWRLAAGLREICKRLARVPEWMVAANAGLAAARSVGDRRAQADMLVNLCDAALSAGLQQSALAHAREALALGRASGWHDVVAAAQDQIGRAYWLDGEVEIARAAFSEAVALFQRLQDHQGAMLALRGNGRVEFDAGAYDTAFALYGRSLRLCRALGDRALEAMALAELGMVHAARGHVHSAAQALRSALRLSRTHGWRRPEALALCWLGGLAAREGQAASARRLLREGLAVVTEHGDRWSEVECRVAAGDGHLALGDPTAAAEHYERALRLSRALRYHRGERIAETGLRGSATSGRLSAAAAAALTAPPRPSDTAATSGAAPVRR